MKYLCCQRLRLVKGSKQSKFASSLEAASCLRFVFLCCRTRTLDHDIMRASPRPTRLSHILVVLHSQPRLVCTEIARLVCYQQQGVNNHVLSGGRSRKTLFLIRNDWSSLVLQRGPILKSDSAHKTAQPSTYSSN